MNAVASDLPRVNAVTSGSRLFKDLDQRASGESVAFDADVAVFNRLLGRRLVGGQLSERVAVEMERRRAPFGNPLVNRNQSSVAQGEFPLSAAGPVDLQADIGGLLTLVGGFRGSDKAIHAFADVKLGTAWGTAQLRPKLVSKANWQIRRKNGISMSGQDICGAAARVCVVSNVGSSRQ